MLLLQQRGVQSLRAADTAAIPVFSLRSLRLCGEIAFAVRSHQRLRLTSSIAAAQLLYISSGSKTHKSISCRN
jgi:hypothetical protein